VVANTIKNATRTGAQRIRVADIETCHRTNQAP